jgi:hypothetical protein
MYAGLSSEGSKKRNRKQNTNYALKFSFCFLKEISLSLRLERKKTFLVRILLLQNSQLRLYVMGRREEK